MNGGILLSIIIVIVLLYFLLTEIKHDKKTDVKQLEQEINTKFSPKKVLIKNNDGLYVCLDHLNRFLYLSDKKNEAEVFLLEYLEKPTKQHADDSSPVKKRFFKDKITLKCSDGYYVGLKYTAFPNEIYDVSAVSNDKNNSTILHIKNNKNTGNLLHIIFYNGYFLNVDEDNYLFSAKNPKSVLLFDFKVQQLDEK